MNIVFVSFSDGRPHSIVSRETVKGINGPYERDTHYDFEYSRTYDQLYWHESGSGGATPLLAYDEYWTAPDIEIEEQPNAKRLDTLPDRYTLENLFDLAVETAGGMVYCSECDDQFPDHSPCKHVWWCDHHGDWSRPQERCGHSYEQSFAW